MKTLMDDLKEFFWLHIEIHDEDKCWKWKHKRNFKGYGRFFLFDREYAASRVAWELTYGQIPVGLLVCHKCDNPSCCNPNHLFLGTPSINTLDMLIKGRESRGQERYNARLNAEDVRTIRELYESGDYTYKKLARMFHVSKSIIGHVVRRTTWKWLE